MKLLLDIKDTKAQFIMELLRNFPFVKTKQLTNYRANVLEGIQEAVEEMNLIKEGKLVARDAEDLINEL